MLLRFTLFSVFLALGIYLVSGADVEREIRWTKRIVVR